jgi:hypothetical protein
MAPVDDEVVAMAAGDTTSFGGAAVVGTTRVCVWVCVRVRVVVRGAGAPVVAGGSVVVGGSVVF